MTIQYSTAVNNARLDAVEASVGASARLKVYTGSVPANAAATASGTLLVDIALPSDWMAAASNSSKAKSGTWSGTAVATGVPGYFRVTDSTGNTAGIQGSAGISTDGTTQDMELDSANIQTGQTVTVSSFTISAPV